MPFQPKETLPDFSALKVIFTSAREQINNYPLYQTIINLLDAAAKSQRILNTQITVLEAEDIVFEINVRDAGYWSPLILDGEDNGDSEMIVTDTNAPIAIWNPTP